MFGTSLVLLLRSKARVGPYRMYMGAGAVSGFVLLIHSLCHIHIHENEMANAATHYEQVEDFVGTEIFMLCVKKGKFQSIYDAPYGINNTTCQ